MNVREDDKGKEKKKIREILLEFLLGREECLVHAVCHADFTSSTALH